MIPTVHGILQRVRTRRVHSRVGLQWVSVMMRWLHLRSVRSTTCGRAKMTTVMRLAGRNIRRSRSTKDVSRGHGRLLLVVLVVLLVRVMMVMRGRRRWLVVRRAASRIPMRTRCCVRARSGRGKLGRMKWRKNRWYRGRVRRSVGRERGRVSESCNRRGRRPLTRVIVLCRRGRVVKVSVRESI